MMGVFHGFMSNPVAFIRLELRAARCLVLCFVNCAIVLLVIAIRTHHRAAIHQRLLSMPAGDWVLVLAL